MFRPVDAVGTIVPRRLTAFDPPVILKIMLHAEHAVAIAAGKRFRILIARRGDDALAHEQSIMVFPRTRRHRLGGCKKKHRTSSSSIESVTIVAILTLYPFQLPEEKRKKRRKIDR